MPVRQNGWREVREVKGEERENSASVYLSVLKERGAEGTGGREDGAEVVALGGVLPHGIGLVCFRLNRLKDTVQ